MKKLQYFVNNVSRVENTLWLVKKIRKVKINPRFCEKELKEFISKIPKYDDIEAIKKLEKETGLVIKYFVFYDKYSYFEYTKLGIWPDNDKKIILPDGSRKIDIEANYLEYFDILVVDKISNMNSNK